MNDNLIKSVKGGFAKHWRILAVAAAAAVFFAAVSSYNFYAQEDGFVKWLSPDETANYAFAKLYAQTGQLSIFEKDNLAAGDIIHPRSVRSDGGYLKPVSFLGIIIFYGKIAQLTSYKVIPYLTPLFAAAGIIYYYLLVSRLFGKTNGLLSAMLLASFPVYLYYSARSMFHNVLFTVFLIVGLYYLLLMAKRWRPEKNYIGYLAAALAGASLGGAAMARSSELLWAAPALGLLWLFNLRKIHIAKLFLLAVFFLLAVYPGFYWNKRLYSSPYASGYPQMNQSIAEIKTAGEMIVKTAVKIDPPKPDMLRIIKNNIFPFGVDYNNALNMFSAYFINMFSWIFWPALFGLVIFIRDADRWQKKHWAYISVFTLASVFLVLYYGSWRFNDNPDPTRATIGNSYTRYWLFVYLGAFPFVALFISKLSAIVKMRKGESAADYRWPWVYYLRRLLIPTARFAVIAAICAMSVRFVVSGSEEGLITAYRRQLLAREEFKTVLAATEADAAVITRYHDKVFFPERKVIVGIFDDDNMIRGYAALARVSPVYYYNFTLPEKDLAYLNKRRLVPFALELRPVKKVNGDFTLYRVERK